MIPQISEGAKKLLQFFYLTSLSNRSTNSQSGCPKGHTIICIIRYTIFHSDQMSEWCLAILPLVNFVWAQSKTIFSRKTTFLEILNRTRMRCVLQILLFVGTWTFTLLLIIRTGRLYIIVKLDLFDLLTVLVCPILPSYYLIANSYTFCIHRL